MRTLDEIALEVANKTICNISQGNPANSHQIISFAKALISAVNVEQGEPVAIITQMSVSGVPTPNGIDWIHSVPLGSKLYLHPQPTPQDTKRLDWLEKQGMIGIYHTGYGEFRYYAGDIFPPIRDVIDKAIAKEES